MVEAQPQFTPRQILEAGQRAVAEGRIEYARQFFQHLIDHYGDTAEAASARSEIVGLSRATAVPPLASNAPDLRMARPPGPYAPESPRRQPDWPSDPPPLAADRCLSEAGAAPPPRSRALAPVPEKNYIAGRVFTGLLGLFGFLGLPLGIVMLYGVIADPALFETLGITRFAGALWAPLAVFFASIVLILVSQIARAVFDAADAAGDLARLERYRLGLNDEDED